MLGAEPLAVALGRKTFALGFPLRAALRLARRYPDPTQLLHELEELRLSSMALVISECSDTPYSPEQLFDDLDPLERGIQLRELAGALSEHVFALFLDGLMKPQHANQGTPTSVPSKAKKRELVDVYEELFSIAAGPLRWNPSDAWNASPSEIIAANQGLNSLITQILRAVFGSNEDEPDNDTPAQPDTLDRDGLAALKGIGRWQ